MSPLLLVMLGGAIGSGARYLTGVFALGRLGPDYPYGTLAVNVIGGLLMGLLAGIVARHGSAGEPWRLFIGVGVLGGFTTFSSFSLEVVTMVGRGQAIAALGYALLSVTAAVAALFAGLAATRVLA